MQTDHLDDERLERLRHGELDADGARAARVHLDRCAQCRAAYEDATRAEQQVHALLRKLDHAPPAITVAGIDGRRRARRLAQLRRAAGIVLALAIAGSAWALPGSPLRAWADALLRRTPPATSPADSTAPAPIPEPAGMFVHPRDDATLVFVAPAGGHVDVLLHDGAEIEIRTISGNARFSARRDRLDVEGIDGPATFEVRIPRGAPRVELRVADRVVLRKQGDRVTGEFQADASGTHRIQLAPR